MKNDAATPYPGGEPVNPGTTDTIMMFKVNKPLNNTIADTSIADGTAIRSTPLEPIARGFDRVNGITRQLTLNEVLSDSGPLELVLNNSKFNLVNTPQILPGCSTPICRETELPAVGDTEIWELINTTADAHPIHTHLVSFQILDRTPYRSDRYLFEYEAEKTANGVLPGGGPPNLYNMKNADGAIGGNPAVHPFLISAERRDPEPYEMGWKDTVIAEPGEVTRIVIRWAPRILRSEAFRWDRISIRSIPLSLSTAWAMSGIATSSTMKTTK